MVAMTQTPSKLGASIDAQSNMILTWVETTNSALNIMSSSRKTNGAWSMKEKVFSLAANAMISQPTSVFTANGMAWVAWAQTANSGTSTAFSTHLVRRLALMTDVVASNNIPVFEQSAGVNPVIDNQNSLVNGYWGSDSTLASAQLASDTNSSITSTNFQIVNNGNVFYSWTNTSNTGESLSIMRAAYDQTQGYSWSDPNSTMYTPVGISGDATNTSFTTNYSSGDGYALWQSGDSINTSEFMNAMNHFMGSATLNNGDAAQVVVDSAGNAFLILKSAMMNGFGLNVSRRTQANTWSTAVQLHRMGMDAASAINMPNNFLKVISNGEDNLFAVWIENIGQDYRLMSASYDTGTDAWGSITMIANSANPSGINFAAIQSLEMTAVSGNAEIHLILYQDSGSEKAIITADFDGTAWNTPLQRDTQDSTRLISTAPSFASNASGNLIAAWVETQNNMNHVTALIYSASEGWSDAHMVAMAQSPSKMGTTIDALSNMMITWVETSNSSVDVMASSRKANTAWTMKEKVSALAAGTMITPPQSVFTADGAAWIVWTQTSSSGSSINLSNHLVTRLASMTNVVASTNSPSFNNTTNPNDPNNDPNNNNNNVDAPAGVVANLWASSTQMHNTQIATADQAVISGAKLQLTNSGNIFAHWLVESQPDPVSFEFTQHDINIMQGVTDVVGNTVWSNADSILYKPVGYSSAATDSDFVVNPDTGNAIVVWNNASNTMSSEFMQSMGHFMNSATLTSGHTPQVLVDSAGEVYLLHQTHMTGGFGLSVFKRTAADSWSANPVELHRMNMTTAINLPNHFLISVIDGQDNIRAVWLEELSGTFSLQTATYNGGTDTWGAVSTIDTDTIMLNKLVSGIAAGVSGSGDLQVVLHQQDGITHSIHALQFTSNTSSWSLPIQLDAPTSTSSIIAAPAFDSNSAGDVLVAWMETDSAMTANNNSGLMQMLMTRQYSASSGWSTISHIAHGASNADAMALTVALNANGEASASWVENDANASHIISSHKINSNTAWSQKELITSVANTTGAIIALETVIDSDNKAQTFWAVRTTDGSTDDLTTYLSKRATSISDAVVGDNNNPDPNQDPNDPNNNNDDPVVTNDWTAPVIAAEMMHSATNLRFYGPQVALDDLGNRFIRMSTTSINSGNGTTTTTMTNQILRSESIDMWANTLLGSGLMSDLSASAIIEEINPIEATGNLYALIRDSQRLYLARYLPSAGWSKMLMPEDVPSNITSFNLQLTTNSNGMVTIAWHELANPCCSVNIHAKHYMVANGWQAIETITVPAEAALLPRHVDADGNVYVSWLEANQDANVGGFDLKLATYTPMQGWSNVLNGPSGLQTANATSVSNGNYSLVIVTDLLSDMIDAYVIKADGSWTKQSNINGKTNGDGVQLINHNPTQIISGGSERYMIAWREEITMNNGSQQVHNMTALAHHMLNNDGMDMWHWNSATAVSTMNDELENHLEFVLDSMGNAYAVWTSINLADNTNKVYVNQATPDGLWSTTPTLLVNNDLSTGSYTLDVSIDVNALNDVGISWDQHIMSGSMSHHRVWYVEQLSQ